MIVAASDGNNVRPVGNVALAVCVIAHRNDRTVGLEAYRVPVAASDGNNVRPVGNVALAVFVTARRNDRTVGFEAYREKSAVASDRLPFGDVIPKSKAALASILVISDAAERYRRFFVFSVFIKRNGSIIFAV